MLDTPYRVERSSKGYELVHTGDGKVGHTYDAVLAYRIVDLLNKDDPRCRSVPPSTRSAPAST